MAIRAASNECALLLTGSFLSQALGSALTKGSVMGGLRTDEVCSRVCS